MTMRIMVSYNFMLRLLGTSLLFQVRIQHRHFLPHCTRTLTINCSEIPSRLTHSSYSGCIRMASSEPTNTSGDNTQADSGEMVVSGESTDSSLKETSTASKLDDKTDTGGDTRKETAGSSVEKYEAGATADVDKGEGRESPPPVASISEADGKGATEISSEPMTTPDKPNEEKIESSSLPDKEADEKKSQSSKETEKDQPGEDRSEKKNEPVKETGVEREDKTDGKKETKALPSANKSPSSSKQGASKPWSFTRSTTSPVETREYFEKLSLTEKRKLYTCGMKYKQLRDIDTWPVFKSTHGCSSKRTLKQPKLADNAINNKVSLWRGDVTSLEIDAIVNAANTTLMGGGGVDGAIHDAAGRSLRRECMDLNGCSTGDAKISGGHRLPARFIIHTVGPIGERRDQLVSCYERCLELVENNKIKSIAFCCISTGIYGYPNTSAAVQALGTVRNWLESSEYARTEIERVIFCVFLKVDYEIYSELMCLFFPDSNPLAPDSTPTNTGETSGKAERGEKETTPPMNESKETGTSPNSPSQPPTRVPPLTTSVTAPAVIIRQEMGAAEGGESGDKSDNKERVESVTGGEGEGVRTQGHEGEGSSASEVERGEPNAKQPKLEEGDRGGPSDSPDTPESAAGVSEGADDTPTMKDKQAD